MAPNTQFQLLGFEAVQASVFTVGYLAGRQAFHYNNRTEGTNKPKTSRKQLEDQLWRSLASAIQAKNKASGGDLKVKESKKVRRANATAAWAKSAFSKLFSKPSSKSSNKFKAEVSPAFVTVPERVAL